MSSLPADPRNDPKVVLGAPSGDRRGFYPFAGSDAARAGVRRALDRGVRCVTVTGPEGIGKTCLLTDLEQQLGRRFRVAFVPLAALPARELLAWVMGALGQELDGDPAEQLLAAIARPGARPLVLAIDEASAMPTATARQLAAWLTRADGQLRLVLALSPNARAPRVRAALGSDAIDVPFERPLTPQEGEAFVAALVDAADPLPSRRARFDATTVTGLYATAGGLPGRLVALVNQVLTGGPSLGPGPDFGLAGDFDPFAVTANAEAYVARPATEAALDQLTGALEAGTPVLAMIGPPGLGKTQILRVLCDRIADRFHPLHVAYGSLEPEELERWVLSLLGLPGTTTLQAAARQARQAGSPLVLLVDDAGAIPPASLRWLHDRVQGEDALQIVFAATDGGDERPLAALDGRVPAPVPVRLRDPLDVHEAEALVSARLGAAAAPDPVRRAFDARAIHELHAAAAGNPARLQHLADSRVRDLGGGLPAPGRPRASEPRPLDRVRAPRPAAFDLDRVAQPRWLRGRRIWAWLAVAAFLVLLPFLLPGVASLGPPAPTPSPGAEAGPGGLVRVHFQSTPWARVRINGRERGVTPLGNVELRSGVHQMHAELADGRVIEREIQVDASHRHVVVAP